MARQHECDLVQRLNPPRRSTRVAHPAVASSSGSSCGSDVIWSSRPQQAPSVECAEPSLQRTGDPLPLHSRDARPPNTQKITGVCTEVSSRPTMSGLTMGLVKKPWGRAHARSRSNSSACLPRQGSDRATAIVRRASREPCAGPGSRTTTSTNPTWPSAAGHPRAPSTLTNAHGIYSERARGRSYRPAGPRVPPSSRLGSWDHRVAADDRSTTLASSCAGVLGTDPGTSLAVSQKCPNWLVSSAGRRNG